MMDARNEMKAQNNTDGLAHISNTLEALGLKCSTDVSIDSVYLLPQKLFRFKFLTQNEWSNIKPAFSPQTQKKCNFTFKVHQEFRSFVDATQRFVEQVNCDRQCQWIHADPPDVSSTLLFTIPH